MPGPKDDLNKTLEQVTKEVAKQSKHLIESRKATLEAKGYTAEQIEKHNIRMIDRMAKDRKVHAEKARREDWEQREKALEKELLAMKGMNETEAKARAQQVIKSEKAADDKKQEREKTFFGRLHNTVAKKFDKGKGSEERIEALRQQKGFFAKLKGIFSSKKDGDKDGGGFMGGMMKTVKKVFNLIKGKFLLIGALVVGLISQMNMEQLKATWESLKTAFTAIWKFLKPIVTTIGEWISNTAIPALVDYFIQTFKNIGELFSKLTARFKGFTEMSWVDRMWAILGAFKDIGSFLADSIGNFAVTVEKMFGGDGTWITGIWKSITGFFNGIWNWIKLLFTDPVKVLDEMIMGTASMLTDFAGWLHRTMLVPLIDWFKSLFDFSSISGVLATLINLNTLLPNLFKDFLIDPAVKWIGDKFGFDTSSFTEFSIGELVMRGVNKAVGWLEEKFDFKMPEFSMPDWDVVGKIKDLVKGMIKGVPDIIVPDKILKWANAKPKKKTPVIPSDTRPEKEKKKDFGRWSATEEGKAYIKSFKDDGPDGKGKTGIIGSSKRQKRAHAAFMAEQNKPKVSRIQKGINKRLRHKKLAEQHKAGKSGELAQIQADEGFEEGVYEDTMGIKTIGYGFNLERAGSQEALDAAGIKKSLTDLKGGNANLTEEEASRLMQGEMGHFKGVAERYVGTATWKKLSPNRQGILTNMAYNMGEGTLGKFANLRKAIQKGDWKQAQAEMKDSAWAGQVKGRADRLVARMGGDAKSQALGTAQTGYTAATSQGGQPIYVTKNTIDKSTNVNKGGDTHQHPTGATSDMGSGKQGDLKTV